jgi:hypothetical protein
VRLCIKNDDFLEHCKSLLDDMRDITRNEFVPSLAPKSDLRGLENKLEHVQEQLALQMQSQNKAVHEDI